MMRPPSTDNPLRPTQRPFANCLRSGSAATWPVKIRLLGEKSSTKIRTSRYAHTAFHTARETESFSLEGPPATARRNEAAAGQLLQICKEEGVKCECEYVEVNQDGDEISDHFRVT